MGWVLAITMFMVGCFNQNETLVLTSGLYAIAGSIGLYLTKNEK